MSVALPPELIPYLKLKSPNIKYADSIIFLHDTNGIMAATISVNSLRDYDSYSIYDSFVVPSIVCSDAVFKAFKAAYKTQQDFDTTLQGILDE